MKQQTNFILSIWFQKKHSTEYALVYFEENAKKALENENHCIGIYLDINKASDYVNHDILVKKL